MRIRIDHATRYDYASPARFIIQSLRLTPSSNEGQQVRDWRLETDVDARLRRSEDAFGNIVHTLYTERSASALTIRVSGEVATADTGGMVRGIREKLAPQVFLRSTPMTAPDRGLSAFASKAAGKGGVLDRAHSLMAAIRDRIVYDAGFYEAARPAAEAFARGHGVCQDHAQIFIACARRLGIPARYVSGHLCRTDGQVDQEASHAWAEAYIEDLGWVGFDAANGVCPDDAYVRVAVGLDALGAAPIRGTSYGGGAETLSVRLSVRRMQQAQAQQQRMGWS